MVQRLKLNSVIATGRTYDSVGLRPEQIMVLRFEPASPNKQLEMVTV